MLRAWRRFYGENPLHLLAMLGCFALVGYVVSFVYADPTLPALLIWFLGAVIAHDLVLYPLYALADRSLVLSHQARRRGDRRPPLVPAINHVRAPVLGSAVLGLIYLPTITRHGEDALRFTSGLGAAGFLRNWLLVTAVLFLGSAVVYAVRLGIATRAAQDADRAEPGTAEPHGAGEAGGAGGAGEPHGAGRGADETGETGEPHGAGEAGEPRGAGSGEAAVRSEP